MKDELIGKAVLVHPGLQHDPAHKQNEVGLIKIANVFSDEFLVGFDDGKDGLYAADALLVFKPHEEIHQFLVFHANEMAYPDLRALTHVDLLLHYGYPEKALNLAKEQKSIQDVCLHSLDRTLDVNQSYER